MNIFHDGQEVQRIVIDNQLVIESNELQRLFISMEPGHMANIPYVCVEYKKQKKLINMFPVHSLQSVLVQKDNTEMCLSNGIKER